MKTLGKLLLLALPLAGCFTGSEAPPVEKKTTIHGNWLVTGFVPQLRGDNRERYKPMSDSLLKAVGLKLLRFDVNGKLYEGDSIGLSAGEWNLTKDSLLQITTNGNLGSWEADIQDLNDDTMDLSARFPVDEVYSIKTQLTFVRITDSAEAVLFTESGNEWRKKPTAPESDEVLKKRLASILRYYGAYFRTISNHSNVFMSSRVILPVQLYQHAIGVKTSMTPGFIGLFYNESDAAKAHKLLGSAISAIDSDSIKSGGNYLDEYAQMMDAAAATLR